MKKNGINLVKFKRYSAEINYMESLFCKTNPLLIIIVTLAEYFFIYKKEGKGIVLDQRIGNGIIDALRKINLIIFFSLKIRSM
jgi:hypothetical protein